MTEIRHGNRNRRNLYAGPTEQDHFAVTIGPIEHAAAMSGWLADAARAWEAAGHPMPQPARSRDELIEQVAQLLSKMHVDSCSSGEDEARALAEASLLADPEQVARFDRYIESYQEIAAERDLLAGELERVQGVADYAKSRIDAALARARRRALVTTDRRESMALEQILAALQGDSASTQASPQAAPSVQASGEALEPHECEKCADHVACVCLPRERPDD